MPSGIAWENYAYIFTETPIGQYMVNSLWVTIPTVIWGQALDGSLAKTVLDGWTPRVELREGIRQMFSYAESKLEAATAAAQR